MLWLGCQDYPRGEQIYLEKCASCHMPDGTGLGAMIPSLGYSKLLKEDRVGAICLIRNGLEDPDSSVIMTPMPAYPELTKTDISNLINYMHTSWGNDLPLTSPDEVEQALEACGDGL
jgi:mono/diheme cytochrome c family protein